MQFGLTEWTGGQGRQSPTWEVLLQAMDSNNNYWFIAVHYIDRLKAKLLGWLWELFMYLDLCVCMHVCV